MFELRQCEEDKGWKWNSLGETEAELRMERQSGSKILPIFQFALCPSSPYFTLSEMEPEAILNKLVVKQLGVDPWLTSCLIEIVREKAVDAVASGSIVKNGCSKCCRILAICLKEKDRTCCCCLWGMNVYDLGGPGKSRDKLKNGCLKLA